MTHDEMIEAVARAWCEASGKDPDKLTPAPRGVVGLVPLWTLFEPQARAAIHVIAPAVEQETVAKIVAWLRDQDGHGYDDVRANVIEAGEWK